MRFNLYAMCAHVTRGFKMEITFQMHFDVDFIMIDSHFYFSQNFKKRKKNKNIKRFQN